MGGRGGCDRRIEVFGKIHKKIFLGGGVGSGWCGGGGVRVDVNEELKFEVFVKIKKKYFFCAGGGGGGSGGVMSVRGGGGGGGAVGWGGGQGGCERRIGVF